MSTKFEALVAFRFFLLPTVTLLDIAHRLSLQGTGGETRSSVEFPFTMAMETN